MTNKERTETVLSKQLRMAMSESKKGERELADEAGLSVTAIRKILTGRTRTIRSGNLEKIARVLRREPDFFQGEANAHLSIDRYSSDFDLERMYGPSIRSAFKLGGRRTSWLLYDFSTGPRYDPNGVIASIVDRDAEFPDLFINYRNHIEANNEKLIADRSLGKPYFDGPTFCLSRYLSDRTADGHETKTFTVELSRSRYANNMTAKSASAANLRKKAPRNFNFRDQPIEWLASGIGVAVVVFCDEGKNFVAAKRSKTEKFRSLEWDISAVEGINPVKDRRLPESDVIFIHDVVARAVSAELGITVAFDDINVIGFGVDLEYYQWNFIAYVDSRHSFRQIEDVWPTADESDETVELKTVPVDAVSAASFIRDHTVWSCGMAALYYALIKRFGGTVEWRDSFHAAFSDAPGKASS